MDESLIKTINKKANNGKNWNNKERKTKSFLMGRREQKQQQMMEPLMLIILALLLATMPMMTVVLDALKHIRLQQRLLH